MIRCQFEHYYFDLEIEDHQNHPIERKREKKFIQKNCSGFFIAKKQRITLDKKEIISKYFLVLFLTLRESFPGAAAQIILSLISPGIL